MQTPYAFVVELDQPLPAALDALRGALAAEQMGVVSEVDVQATLKTKLGLDVPPHKLLGICSPRIAHDLIRQEPDIGALLPCGGSAIEHAPGRTRIALQDPPRDRGAGRQPGAALGLRTRACRAAPRGRTPRRHCLRRPS